MLCLILLSACSDSNSSGVNAQNTPLSSCADTDSCASNPNLEIGNSRPAEVLIPSNYTTSTRYPLIIVLHGFGVTGRIQSDYMGFTDRVDSQQFVLVLPNGTQNADGSRFWNATPACCATVEEQSQIDDVAYIRSLIEEAAATYSIDVTRVGLFGHSNGGFMALRLACEASDLVASVVSLAGSTFADDSSCAPATNPVSILAMHGDLDETIFYDGRENGVASYPAATETIRRFAAHARCDSNNSTMGANLDVLRGIEGAETTVLSYPDCPEDVDMELWTLVGGPHIPFPWVDSAIDSIVDWMIDHQRL
jgi:polyhydroxybutyrate depolymerase